MKELVRLVVSGNLKKKYQKIQDEFKKSAQIRNVLVRKLKIKSNWKRIFDVFGDFMVTKIYRRYAQVYALYRMEFILKEIGKRLDLTLMQIKFMLPQEIKKDYSLIKSIKKKLKNEQNFVFITRKKGKERKLKN